MSQEGIMGSVGGCWDGVVGPGFGLHRLVGSPEIVII